MQNMKTLIVCLALIVFGASSPLMAQCLLSETPDEIIKYFSDKDVISSFSHLDDGTITMSFSDKKGLQTWHCYLYKDQKRCYYQNITFPASYYETAKSDMMSDTKTYTYVGKTDEGYPYWTQIVAEKIIIYWVLKSQVFDGTVVTVVSCGFIHP